MFDDNTEDSITEENMWGSSSGGVLDVSWQRANTRRSTRRSGISVVSLGKKSGIGQRCEHVLHRHIEP
ncbi:hypothetical protein E2C01_101029 [Portunus trituberculatus]|uniref:Uncharacterized protein n=1 Tax=Portunus trituberculatus TaxID=210409 RepID=A0A5B7KKZ2_PORTR|nr:hypothetical protein [Portunus trituberculatus]